MQSPASSTTDRPFAPALLLGCALLGASAATAADTGTDPDATDDVTASGDVTLFGLVRLRRPDTDGDDDGNAFGAFVRFDGATPSQPIRRSRPSTSHPWS